MKSKSKLQIITILIITLLFSIGLISRNVYAQTYTLYSDINTSVKYASNTYYEWRAHLSSAVSGIAIDFSFSWLGSSKRVFTDSSGKVSVSDVKTPSGRGTHTIRMSSPANLFSPVEVQIQVEKGVYAQLEYYSKQSYDPNGEAITIYLYPKDTDMNATVEVTGAMTASITNAPSSVLNGKIATITQLSTTKYKAVFTTQYLKSYVSSIEGKYEIKVTVQTTIAGIEYVTVPTYAYVDLSSPCFLVKAVVGDVESYIGYNPDFSTVTKDLHIKKGSEYIDVYFYNTKGVEIEPSEVDFTLSGGTSGIVYDYPSTLFAEKISANHYRVWHILDEVTYDFTVTAKMGVLYVPFTGTLKISTVGYGSIWDIIMSFLYNPYLMLPILIIFIAFLVWIFGGRKKHEEE